MFIIRGFFGLLNRCVLWTMGLGEKAMDEYAKRFVMPLKLRAESLEIPEDEQEKMWQQAVKMSSPDYPPGLVMRDMLDAWEEGHKPAPDAEVEETLI